MPKYQAAFHKRSSVKGLEAVGIRQKFSNHTVATLDYSIRNKHEYLLPPERTPLALRFGDGPTNVRTFYGYVNHYETVTGDNGQAMTRLVALGTSMTMNAANPDAWQGSTRSHIVREIAAKHRLRSVVHDHPYVLTNWATGPRSDFQALKALAEETGFRLWIDGSTVYFLDPSKLLRTASTMSAPMIRQRDIKKIQVMGGTNIPGMLDKATRRMQFGLDYRTNEFFESTSGDKNLPGQMSAVSAATYSEAQAIADAVDRKQQDSYVLKASVRGAAAIQPGTLIRVESGRVNTDQSGLWLVSEATHELTDSDFTTHIVATRGADQQPLLRAQTTVRGAAGLTQAVVRDGVTWEAALQEHVHV